MVLCYVNDGSLDNWIKKELGWHYDTLILSCIIKGLEKIHEKKMVHRDFHIGNILLRFEHSYYSLISDMGLCG